jgi:phosphatidylserine/phosphatidylglycerophosphate/cardiolipin synthase-like enzyme
MKQKILTSLLCLFFSFASAQEKQPITNYQVFFSPEDRVADTLISMIEKEKNSVKAAVYCLMHRGIAKALMDAYHRGVKVEVIIDPYSVKSRSPVKKMSEAQVPLFVWNPRSVAMDAPNGKKAKKRRSLMHDKFCVLGNSRVWTGSFNFTAEAANANQENVIVLDNEEIASRYLKEFDRLKREGCQPFSTYVAEMVKPIKS